MKENVQSPLRTTPEEQKRGFLVLYVCLICLGMGRTIMFSILPPLGREMGLSELQVAAIFATNACAWVIFSPMWGRKSDMWGRRVVMLIGLFGYAVSLLAVGIVTQIGLAGVWPLIVIYPLLVAARLIFGLVGSGAPPAAQAYVTDRTSPDERSAAMARFAGAMGFGSIIGPAFGGILVAVSFLTPIYFVGFLAFCSGVLVWLYLPERRAPHAFQSCQQRINFWSPVILPFVLANVTYGVAMAIGQQVIAYYSMDVFGMTSAGAAKFAGFGLMAAACTTLATQIFVMPRLRPDPGVIIKVGYVIVIAAFGIMALSKFYYVLMAGMALLGVGYGLVVPSITTAASLVVGPDRQGAAAGVLNAALAAGNIVGALVGLGVYQYAASGPYLLAVLLSGAFLLYALLEPRINVSVRKQAS